MLVHKLRAECDAILVGRITAERDHPRLNVREWSGPDPRRIVLSHVSDGEVHSGMLPQLLAELQVDGVQSLLVEGGAKTLHSFLDNGWWDEIRVETAPSTFTDGTRAPLVPSQALLTRQDCYDGQVIRCYTHRE